MEGKGGEKEIVCVTGAGGFVASWLVKLLLSQGYRVHGTVRDPWDDKNSHLKKLENASENLKLFKANLMDYGSLRTAIEGCSGVFHAASPVLSTTVQNPEVEVIEPAVKGTINVLEASLDAKVKRVVFVSSLAAVTFNPKWADGQVLDETCWSDKEYCRKVQHWYRLSKTEAESEALEFAKRNGLDLVTVCPTLIWGPVLHSTVNASTLILIKILKGSASMEYRPQRLVDVRDLAQAVLLTYEKPEAEGRYLCVSHHFKTQELIEKLRSFYPKYNHPTNACFVEAERGLKVSSAKLEKLGWGYRGLEETLIDSVESCLEAGLLE
ncbi:cinnamoyl-CoA reductase 1-like [Argentina anserina]|uniref:cinnamoyl-CoA reductase 1-like n=1 Tax=Argentina anserina TaxID=57926 RepID=UPI00217637B0|nr:cinnamoyl-CoA reductase 1-like [Potentilla anserina]